MENTKTRRAPTAFTLSLVGRAVKAIEREAMNAAVLAEHLGISEGQVSRLVPAIRRTGLEFPSVMTRTGRPGRLSNYELTDKDRARLEAARAMTIEQVERAIGAEVLRLALEAQQALETFPMLREDQDG